MTASIFIELITTTQSLCEDIQYRTSAAEELLEHTALTDGEQPTAEQLKSLKEDIRNVVKRLCDCRNTAKKLHIISSNINI